MTDLRLAIWDVDGTMAETEEVHREAFNGTFKEHGFEWEWSRSKYQELLRVTGGVERITHFVRTERPGELPEDTMAATVRELHMAKTANYVAVMERGDVPLRPGVERLMIEARDAGVRLAVATTTSAANVEALLGHSPDSVRMDWFEIVGAGGVVSNKKPAPRVALKFLNIRLSFILGRGSIIVDHGPRTILFCKRRHNMFYIILIMRPNNGFSLDFIQYIQ